MKKVLVSVVIILIIIGGGYWLSMNKGVGISQNGNASTTATLAGSTSGEPDLAKAAELLTSADLSESYTDPKYGFALSYPAGLEMTEIPGDEGSGTKDMLIFEQQGTDLGFQIVVSPFDEVGADITPERIKQDIPDMVINDPQDVNLGDLGKGTTFLDGDPSKSDTNRQIWFAAKGYIFQITSQPVFDKAMQHILATWKFN